MKARILIGLAAALLVGGGTAVAQQDPAKCATTKVAGATIADLPGLLADAACFARNASSAITSQKLRLDKATELAKAAPAPTPTPTPTPTPVGDQEEPELGKSLDKIPAYVPSNFDTAKLIQTGWPLPATGAPDTVGAFRFMCEPGQILRDDPIVFPGQPGKSHLHQFFGNLTANAYSTYTSLRSNGKTTCVNELNRSAYWIPAMLDGLGNVVVPDYLVVYYKRLPASSPECTRQAPGGCVELPRGLRYIFGYDMVSDTQKTGSFYYNCDGPSAKPGHYNLITDVAPNCGPGNRLGAVNASPSCWDGKHLDSPNHRDHVGYPSYGSWGYLKCPDNLPYVIPTFTLGAWYSTGDLPIGAKGSPATWTLSSDSMNMNGKMYQMRPGETLHADWLGAWDEPVMKTWTENCINKLLSCNSADLGNGTAMIQPSPFKWTVEKRLVPIPATS